MLGCAQEAGFYSSNKTWAVMAMHRSNHFVWWLDKGSLSVKQSQRMAGVKCVAFVLNYLYHAIETKQHFNHL